jgi:inosine-uridine nucleoside N-ribohydrolase
VQLWIDTDIGDNPDDTVALFCAAHSEHTELIGVSTVDGDVGRRADYARAIVPGVDVFAGMPPREGPANADVLLAIGPWTNVAALAEADALPRRVVLMGGVLGPVEYRGAVQTVEHNVVSDPAAAAQLLASTGNLIVVPLDATARIRASEHDETLYGKAIPGFVDQLAWWRETNGQLPLTLHDPAALLVALGEPVARIEARRLTVESDGVISASVDGPLQQVVAHVDARQTIARVRELVGEGD